MNSTETYQGTASPIKEIESLDDLDELLLDTKPEINIVSIDNENRNSIARKSSGENNDFIDKLPLKPDIKQWK